MSNPYIGEIRIFAGNFAPSGWAFCHGQLLPISENDALFTLIGTTYGGDGEETFALPNLIARVPIHQGASYPLGQTGGVEEVALAVTQIAGHSHPLTASSDIAQQANPAGNVVARPPATDLYTGAEPDVAMAGTGPAGGGVAHTNLQPYLGLNFIISLYGVYPPPS